MDTVRLHFDNLIALARAERTLKGAVAVGSLPPELSNLWPRLEQKGVKVKRYDHGERNVPDLMLQNCMYQYCVRAERPGTSVLLSGDGRGYLQRDGFFTAL